MSDPEPTVDRVTALTFEVIDKGDGVYDVEEYEEPVAMMAAEVEDDGGQPGPTPSDPPAQPGQHHYSFSKSVPLGMVDLVSVSGYVDTDTHKIGAQFKVAGFPIQKNPYEETFDKGITVNLPKRVATGSLNLNVNGKNVELKYSILLATSKKGAKPHEGTITVYTLP